MKKEDIIDVVKQSRKLAREEEIKKYGKSIVFKVKIKESRKTYKRSKFRDRNSYE